VRASRWVPARLGRAFSASGSWVVMVVAVVAVERP
jgi:hypothetical protein